jgi:hypothetical protein
VAVLLTWALFLGWTAIGLAVLNAAGLRNGTRKLLLAPALGVVPAAVLAYTGVKLGFTVRESGPAIGIAVLLFALVVLWLTRGPRARVLVVARRQLPFAGVLVAAFALTAWPMFKYGFDWVANGNDDYANYCLGATGFRDHGYLRQPTEAELLAQQDATLPLWYLYFDDRSPRETRCGSELVLALVSTWTGLAPQQAFMPVVASFHLALVSAAAGLVLAFTRRRAAALATAGLLAVSSELTYGFLQQLIAQAVGLALLCAALALLRLPVRRVPYGALARRALAGGAACAGLLLFYPELIPLFVGAAVLLGARDLVLRRPVRRHLWHAGAAVAVMALALPGYLVGATHFLLFQAAHGAGGGEIAREVFPYFLTPRGPALVSGLLPLYANLPEPLHTAALLLGPVALVGLLLVAVAQFRRGRPFAALVLVTAALAALLYKQQAGFGLFKLAMFAQPFVWATAAGWAVTRARRATALTAAAVLLCGAALNARTQAWYVRESVGAESRVDLPAASRHRALSEFRAALASRVSIEHVVVASENNVLNKLLTTELRSRAFTQLGTDPGVCLSPLCVAAAGAAVRDPCTGAPLHALWHEPAEWRDALPDRALLVAGVGPLSVLNRYRHPETGPALLCAPLSEVRNFAAFRDATGARQNFFGMIVGQTDDVALNRLEPDPALRHRTFAGVGRAVVVEVLNPDPMVRAVVSYTATHLPDADSRAVPAIRVVGADRVHLPRAGSGAARLVSPPVAPQAVGRAGVLVLEIDKPLARNPNRLSGLEALWGADVPRDRRHLAGHLRELSLISEEEYAGFRPPERLAKIPADFAHPHIEFSGFLEDGWVERGALVRLTRPAGDRDLVIRGHCPGHDPNFRPELTVLVDGSPVLTRALEPGEFELRAPAGSGTGPKWVELRFDRTTRLPAPDHRPASALVRTVGFEPPAQPEGTARR